MNIERLGLTTTAREHLVQSAYLRQGEEVKISGPGGIAIQIVMRIATEI